MKSVKKFFTLSLALILAFGIAMTAEATSTESAGMAALPAGTYTYVDEDPTAETGSNEGQVQFLWTESKLVWAFGGTTGVMTGSEALSGDELEFFQGLYLSDRPVYDWLASALRDTDGYAGNVADNLLITINDEGKISKLRLDDGKVQMLAVVSESITADVLTVSGATRGQPNLLHSCITLLGSTNCLYLTDQGNVVLDEISIGSNEDGIGLMADKIGGDTFVAGTVVVDGTIEWNCRYANIQPVHADEPATLMTNGQDITLGGMNIGRTGRDLTISTGEDLGGDITIGAVVSVDYGRGGLLEDPSTGTLLLSTTGDIIAGHGNVTIGTNTERKVTIDTVGNIQGANVTIQPTHNGTISDVQGTIGNIAATESINLEIGSIGGIGTLTAENGDITVISGDVEGAIGDVDAPNGTVTLTLASAQAIGNVSGANVVKDIGTVSEKEVIAATPISSTVIVNGETIEFDAYTINSNNYFKIRDIALALSGTEGQFDVYWQDGVANTTITLTSGQAYTTIGGEMSSKGTQETQAELTTWNIYLDRVAVTLTSYSIDGEIYFKLRDLGEAFDFGVEWDSTSNAVIINTSVGYTET